MLFRSPNPIDAPIEVEYVDSDQIPADKEGLDIGPKTQELFANAVKSAKTVVWNGPMGVFENPTLAKGTIAVAKALAETDATTIIPQRHATSSVSQTRCLTFPQAAALPSSFWRARSFPA